ncbi:TonB-dependent receptor plug domain-containing protein [Flavobacterium sp. PLA-1-15]|uniref:TonB-dependent receptor plug domain-containing protein n=1 Tax=Flavobacterium sp. PLA-1-15 TaxID=3380533 RepID=UPI003B82938D
MILKTQKLLCLFLIIFSISGSVYSQQEKGIQPLKEILKAISKQHNVQFNYIEEEVSVIKLKPPVRTLALTEKLEYLEAKTTLEFEIINTKYIAVSSKKVSVAAIPQPNDTILPIDLSEIKIERYLTTGMSKNIDGTFTVNPKKFGILPGLIEPDALQTMQQIPGIYSADQTISNINVRSGTHDQNLFLWNGIRMFQTGHFFGLISAFNPSLAQKINISKNGSSAFYGESISSVIDISSVFDGIENSNYGVSSNLISAEFNAKVKTSKKSSFQISGRRSFTDLASSPTYDSYFDRVFQNTMIKDLSTNQNINYKTDEKFYFYDFTAQYQQKIGYRTELIVDAIGINNALKITQSDDSRSRKSDLEQQNFGGSLTLKTKWTERMHTKVSGYASYYNLDATNEAIENDQVLSQQNRVFDYGWRLENKHILSENLTFNNGYQYNEIGVTSRELVNNPQFGRKVKEVLRMHALVLETEYKNNDGNLFLKAGLRNNYIEDFSRFIIEPRLQFNFSLSKKLNIEVLGEQKSQVTSQIIDMQQDFLGIEKRRWTLANDENIPIQRSRQVSLGFSYKDRNWLVTVDNYYKKVKGIYSPSQAFQNQLEFMRINGDYSVIGSEVLVQRNLKHFYTWLSYGLSNSEYTFSETLPQEFANNFQIVHTVSWAGIYEWKNLKVALGSKWHSGRPETSPSTSNLDFSIPSRPQIIYSSPNNRNMSDFFEVNLSANYSWVLSPKSSLQFGVSVLNILNRTNIVNRYYRVNATNESIESVNTVALRRTPNLSVRYAF